MQYWIIQYSTAWSKHRCDNGLDVTQQIVTLRLITDVVNNLMNVNVTGMVW
jgi:hypothetical protein